MRPAHFEALRPVCPLCRSARDACNPLELGPVEREERGHVVEGLLRCAEPACQREYPIIDGIPILVADIRGYIAAQVPQIDAREDLSPSIESVLGDCCGPGSPFQTAREHLSIYAWDHYGDLDPEEPQDGPRPGSVRELLANGLAHLDGAAAAPAIDLGCSVGRTSFELAARSDGLVLGVDLHYAMLRVAARVLREATVRYPRRRVGLVFDRREFPAALPHADRVDFWACDAAALPFAPATFRTALSLNLIDCVAAPREALVSMAECLAADGAAVISTPYDWSVNATPVEGWLGGHSQRGPAAGASEPVLRALLTPGAHPAGVPGLSLVAERERVPWRVRTHERSAVDYQAHLVVARKR